MKILKIFLQTYETAIIWAILPMPAFVVPFDIMIREQLKMPAFIICFGFPLLGLLQFCDILFKKETLYQLPMSQRMKFFVPQAMVLICLIITCLMSILIEGAAQILAPEYKVHAGDFLKNIFAYNGNFIIFPVVYSLALFISSLLRKGTEVIGALFGFGIAICAILTSFEPRHFPAIVIVGCLVGTLLLIFASYQLYKRWQPANDGFLRI